MTNLAVATIANLLAGALMLAGADARAAAAQCACSATVKDLSATRAARVAPPLDGAELHYRIAGKCSAQVSEDGRQISGSFRSKVEIRSLRAKKSAIENDVVWFAYDQDHGSSLHTNYVSADKDVAATVGDDGKGRTLTLSVVDDVRYAPSAATVPYVLHKGGKVGIVLRGPQCIFKQ